jgi:hypothetical protein
MSWLKERTSNRRDFLRTTVPGVLAVAAGAATILKGGPAQAKAPKDSVAYQETPKGDENCANCQFYIPPEGGGDVGKCQIVAGDIGADHWCNLWASK